MITVYVVSFEDPADDWEKVYVTEKSARTHIEQGNRHFDPDRDDPGLHLQYRPRQADRIAEQRVLLRGDDISYQFNRNSMGERTLTRTVRNLRREGQSLYGDVKFKGRLATVQHVFLNYWRSTGHIRFPGHAEEKKLLDPRHLDEAVGEEIWVLPAYAKSPATATVLAVREHGDRLSEPMLEVDLGDGDVELVHLNRCFDHEPQQVTEEDAMGQYTTWK